MSSSSSRGTLARPGRTEVGFYHLRVLAHLGGRSLGDLLSVIQHRHPVGDAHDHPHLVLDEQHGDPAVLTETPDQVGQPGCLLRVHPGSRLVQQQELRLGGQGPGYLQPPLVPVREVLGEHLPPLDAGEVQELGGLLAGFALLAPRSRRAEDGTDDAALQARVHPGEHVVHRAHGAEEPDVLEGAPDTHPGPAVGSVARYVAAEKREVARGYFVESAHHVEERSLAGAVRPDQADDGTLRYVVVHGTDRDAPAESLGDPTCHQYVGVTGASALLSHGSTHSSPRVRASPPPVGGWGLSPPASAASWRRARCRTGRNCTWGCPRRLGPRSRPRLP